MFGSSLEERPRYTPSECFETFPFPSDWQDRASLETAGRHYYEFRAALMVRNNKGLTKTYNRFHDPDERDPDIVRLRELHDAMDRAVLDAYSWTDLRPACEFVREHEDESADELRSSASIRYRWPNEVRDEVLGRLLALNQQRAREEALAGEDDAPPRRRRAKKAPRRQNATECCSTAEG